MSGKDWLLADVHKREENLYITRKNSLCLLHYVRVLKQGRHAPSMIASGMVNKITLLEYTSHISGAENPTVSYICVKVMVSGTIKVEFLRRSGFCSIRCVHNFSHVSLFSWLAFSLPVRLHGWAIKKKHFFL